MGFLTPGTFGKDIDWMRFGEQGRAPKTAHKFAMKG